MSTAEIEIPDINGTSYSGLEIISLKPSRDFRNRGAVNGRLRRPEYKNYSHRPSRQPLSHENGMIYGTHLTMVDASRLHEYHPSERQQTKVFDLLELLRKSPERYRRRHEYMLELLEDLETHPLRIFPLQSQNVQFMSTLKNAVHENVQVYISIFYPAKDDNVVGYIVSPVR